MSNYYKFTPIILVRDKDGKIEITEEKLKEMLKDAYNNGYKDGKDSQPVVCPTSPLTIPNPTIPTIPYNPSPYWIYPSKPYVQCNTDCTGTHSSGNLGDIRVEGKV